MRAVFLPAGGGDRISESEACGIEGNTPEAMKGRGRLESLPSREPGCRCGEQEPAEKSTGKPVARGEYWYGAGGARCVSIGTPVTCQVVIPAVEM